MSSTEKTMQSTVGSSKVIRTPCFQVKLSERCLQTIDGRLAIGDSEIGLVNSLFVEAIEVMVESTRPAVGVRPKSYGVLTNGKLLEFPFEETISMQRGDVAKDFVRVPEGVGLDPGWRFVVVNGRGMQPVCGWAMLDSRLNQPTKKGSHGMHSEKRRFQNSQGT
ncbi:hypothetical protein NE237_015914 [Protea cynaroides]|uniref:Uncharacterized protein n=1 Tax=Protea cynaroides TaxID=273540 RepID=A0A9Q0KEM8_9MAGN|nr:hypothetical protein NE237_015914 [Protea cynaroides]